MNRLLNIGFKNIGHWSLVNDSIHSQLLEHHATKNILYGFISNGEVMYIGKTVSQLALRMRGYQRPHTSQRTNVRVNANIKAILAKNIPIDIFILADNGLLKYGDFRINLASGLEDTLIYEIGPVWNFMGKSKIKLVEDAESDIVSLVDVSENFMVGEAELETFAITLGTTYYNQGFFNVNQLYAPSFGADGAVIEIQLGDNPEQVIQGYINRTANSNGTPRIMGGRELKGWIQQMFQENDLIRVTVLSPVSIRLNVAD